MGRPTAVFVDRDAIKSNFDIAKSFSPNSKFVSVIKANAYGHGAIEVSKALEEEGVRYLAVFTIDEGIELRDAGIKTDIFIYAKFDPTRIEDATKHNLTLNISSFDDLKVLKAHTGNTIKVHLKIDTGMTRLGVPLDQAEAFLKEADQLDSIELEGLYSHFATADEGDLSYANSQLSKFNEVIEISKKLEMSPTFIHCSNSGAILNVEESRFNMIRTGTVSYTHLTLPTKRIV